MLQQNPNNNFVTLMGFVYYYGGYFGSLFFCCNMSITTSKFQFYRIILIRKVKFYVLSFKITLNLTILSFQNSASYLKTVYKIRLNCSLRIEITEWSNQYIPSKHNYLNSEIEIKIWLSTFCHKHSQCRSYKLNVRIKV